MAQITISDESFQALLAIAQTRRVTPATLVEAVITDLQREIAEEYAFWGEVVITDLPRQMAEAGETVADLSDEEFFRAITIHANRTGVTTCPE